MSYPTNRRSARALIGDFIHTACAKLTLSACPSAIEHDLKVQLRVFKSIAIAMKWDDLTKKIDKALAGPESPPPPHPPPMLGNPRFVVSRNPSDSDVATTRIED